MCSINRQHWVMGDGVRVWVTKTPNTSKVQLHTLGHLIRTRDYFPAEHESALGQGWMQSARALIPAAHCDMLEGGKYGLYKRGDNNFYLFVYWTCLFIIKRLAARGVSVYTIDLSHPSIKRDFVIIATGNFHSHHRPGGADGERGTEKNTSGVAGIIKIEFIAGCRFYWSYINARMKILWFLFVRWIWNQKLCLKITGKFIFCLSLCVDVMQIKD